MYFLIYVLLLLIAILVVCAYKLYNNFYYKKLFARISWFATDSTVYRYQYDLLYYISKYQLDLNVEEKYRLNLFNETSEKEIATMIIKDFQEVLTQSFLEKKIPINKKALKLNSEDFFMLMLQDFLVQNELDNNRIFIRKHKIEMYNIEPTYCNGYQFQNYDYFLTEFSTVYQKLLFVCSLYCEKNENVKKLQTPSTRNHSNNAKEVLDAGKTEVIVR